MSPSNEKAEPLDALAEQFLERRRRGDRPSIQDYVDAHPELAERIHCLFPTLEAIEDLSKNLVNEQLPAQLGDYRIVRQLGRGGMGIVYEAVQEPLGRRVALKVLSAPQCSNTTMLERFQREARTSARLH